MASWFIPFFFENKFPSTFPAFHGCHMSENASISDKKVKFIELKTTIKHSEVNFAHFTTSYTAFFHAVIPPRILYTLQ